MQADEFFEMLHTPSVFGKNVKKVTVLQTHISYVVLTDEFAYKIKKPVDFGFLDYSTLEKRKHFCNQEVLLNKRLCPEIYLGLVSLTKTSDSLELDGSGEVVEYAVKMKQFSQDHIMTQLLQEDTIVHRHIDDILSVLVPFYHNQQSSQDIQSYGALESIRQNTDENFEQTQAMIGTTITKDAFDELKQTTDDFYLEHSDVFEHRQSCIKDCHGDLHSGNIVIQKEKTCIFDCIEFNKRFRYIDVASDIGFLAMDLDYLNQPYLSSYLIDSYVNQSNDTGIFDVLNFYKTYRAYVRGKVAGFKLNDPHVSQKDKEQVCSITHQYFSLACYYAKLLQIQMTNSRPLLFMVMGITGTGKSTIAQKLSVDYHAIVINTDIIRKQQAGMDVYERHHDEFDKGLYSPENITQTYKMVAEFAEKQLTAGYHVVVDATCRTQQHRSLISSVAEKHDALVVRIYCVCDDEVARSRLDKRVQSKSISDGRWEIYHQQKDSFESFTDDEKVIIFDTGNEDYEYRMNLFNTIAQKILGEV